MHVCHRPPLPNASPLPTNRTFMASSSRMTGRRPQPSGSGRGSIPGMGLGEHIHQAIMPRRGPAAAVSRAGRPGRFSSSCAIWSSERQMSARITAEPAKANQNGAVTPQTRGDRAAERGADHQAADHAREVDAADAALELGGHGPLPHARRGRSPDERVRAEDEEDRPAPPRPSGSAPARGASASR